MGDRTEELEAIDQLKHQLAAEAARTNRAVVASAILIVVTVLLFLAVLFSSGVHAEGRDRRRLETRVTRAVGAPTLITRERYTRFGNPATPIPVAGPAGRRR